MNTPGQVADELLNLPEEDYFNQDGETEIGLQERLSGIEFEGLAIRTPKTLNIEQTEELPLLMLHQQSGLRQWQVPLRKNCTLIASNLDTGTILVGPAFVEPESKNMRGKPLAEPPQSAAPQGDMARAIVSGAHRFDLRALLNIPWTSARIAVTAVSFNWKSNTHGVLLEGSGLPADEESPPATSPLRAETASAPPAMPAAGIVLSVPEEVAADVTAISVQGALSVPLSQRIDHAVGGVAVTPELPVSLLVFGLDAPGPMRIDLVVAAVPVGEMLQASFEANLLSATKGIQNGTYAVYAVADRYVQGPYRLVVK